MGLWSRLTGRDAENQRRLRAVYDKLSPILVAKGAVPEADLGAEDLREVLRHLDDLKRGGFDLDSPDPKSACTLLAHASASGALPVVRHLVELGADVSRYGYDEPGKDRQTPLMAAADQGHPAVVRYLLEAGADAGATDSHGASARARAERAVQIKSRHGLPTEGAQECVSLLPESRNEPAAKEEPATASGSQGDALVAAAKEADESRVRELLASGVHPDTRADDGGTAMFGASFRGHAGVVRVLIDAGADVHCRMSQSGMPLDLARQRGHQEIVRMLTEAG